MTFLTPYRDFAQTISYAIMQNLESIQQGIIAVFGGAGRISGEHLLGLLTVSILAIMFVAFILSVFCAWKYSKQLLFPMMLLFWLTPGLMDIFVPNQLPRILYSPEEFVTGDGIGHMPVGTIQAGIYATLLALLFGWALFSLIQDFGQLRPHFKSILDHFWYAIGVLVAMTFLIEKNQAQDIAEKIQEESKKLFYARNYISKQIDIINLYQREKGVSNEIFSYFQKQTSGYLNLNSEVQTYFRETPKSDQIFKVKPAIISQINNDLCSSGEEKKYCIEFPLFLGVHVSQSHLIPSSELDKPRFLYAHILVDHINMISKRLETLYEKQRSTQRLDNYHWFAILCLGLIAGGKIAVATRSLIPHRKKPLK